MTTESPVARPDRNPAGGATAQAGPALYFPNRRTAVLRTPDPVCTVAIDAEEDFDWERPVFGTDHTTACMKNIRDLQAIFGAYGIVPTYLLTYPCLADPEVVRIVQRYVGRGECDVGVHLHPWVTPPFDGHTSLPDSFAGNLKPDIEAIKLVVLTRKFVECFGRPPRVYRAGRYGLSESSAGLLEELGFLVDTSLAPRTSFAAEGGPDYAEYDYAPFWFGHRGTLLELPLCRSIVGWGGQVGQRLQQALAARAGLAQQLAAPLAWCHCAERISLSPEGNDPRAMIRLVRRLQANGTRIFALSFHSSSLGIGRNPYVRTRAQLHQFYDRLSGMLDFMARQPGMRFASLTQVAGLIAPEVR